MTIKEFTEALAALSSGSRIVIDGDEAVKTFINGNAHYVKLRTGNAYTAKRLFELYQTGKFHVTIGPQAGSADEAAT